jgi:hypothetical protein
MMMGLVLLAIAIAGLFVIGPERVWRIFGPADLGPVDLATLERRTSPNDALACPAGLCKANADMVPPVFAIDAAGLRAAVSEALQTESHVTRVASDEATLTDRYVQLTPLMRYPDTIVVRAVPLANGCSTLALYSRSKFGHSDLGANKARLERWLGKITAPRAAPEAACGT